MASSQELIQRRRAAVRERMREAGLDALLISNPENRYYVTGFYGRDDGADSAGRVVLTADRVVLLTDGRYTEQAHEEAPDVTVIDRRESLAALVAQTLQDAGWQRPRTGETPRTLGVEADHLTLAQGRALSAAGRRRWRMVPTRRFIEPLRAVKDATEIAYTRRATEITCQTFDHLCRFLRQPDLTERQVAAEIFVTMLRLGADDMAFPPIIGAGPNGARPHAVPGGRVLQPGEPIIIDMGARFRGYCADMTRTVFLDDAPPEWRARYAHVLAANEACERGLHAGIGGRAADALARDTLARAGLAEFYMHGTGHGTGLEIHEAPALSFHAPEDEVLPERSIVTIEPGVYFPGAGGVRIEDAGVVTATGCDILTTTPKAIDMMILRRD
jgi:Xaa-Pro aminopeptidase